MKRMLESDAREALKSAAVENAYLQAMTVFEREGFPRASVLVGCYDAGKVSRRSCDIICESEFRIIANGNPLVNLLCSNSALQELALGFLYSEGVINSLLDVQSCSLDSQAMTASFEVDASVRTPICPTVSSGFGGAVLGSSPDVFARSEKGRVGGLRTVAEVQAAMSSMRSFAREYTVTRGIHCSALFKRGVPLASFEDIGRHNTFDKLAGYCLLNGIDAQGALLTTTGRMSGEMVRKALRLGVSGIASLSGPTDRAVALAQETGIMLAGYVAEESARVYAGM